MKVLSVIIILLISVATYYVGQFILKKTNISPPIIYLVIGIILGGNILNFFTLEKLPSISIYSNVALWLMFIGSGFNSDDKKGKKEGEKKSNGVLKLATIPVYFEILLITGVAYYAINNLSFLGYSLSFFEVLAITSLFAMASPANIIPITTEHITAGRLGRNNTAKNIILSSVMDNFTPMPIMLIALILALSPTLGFNVNPIIILLGTIVLIIISIAFSKLTGIIYVKLLDPYGKKVADGKGSITVYTILFFGLFTIVLLGLMQVPGLSALLGMVAIVMAVTTGGTFKAKEKNGLAEKMRLKLVKGFSILGMPIIFISVGSNINLDVLSNISVLLFFVVFVVVSIILKSIGTKLAMTDSGYSSNDRKYAMVAFVPKGITLVNFSIIVATMLGGKESDLTDIMVTLAAISIIITIPLGVTLMSGKGKKWLSGDGDIS